MKKTISLLTIVFVLCLSLYACGGVDKQDYKDMVSKCNTDIADAGIILSNIGNYEYNYWEASNNIGGNIDYAHMLDSAKKWLHEKGNIEFIVVENAYTNICAQYKEIIKINVSGADVDEINDNFNKLFNAYNGMYLLITSPTGDISSFAENFNTYSDDFKSSNSILSLLVAE
ncbi:MAG: hypothetical protein RR365_14055 [Bacteroides sp.]